MPSKKRPLKRPLATTDVLKEIDDAMVKEEMALPVYASHIESVLFWSGIPKRKQDRIRESLEILIRESIAHVKMLKYIKTLHARGARPNRA